MFHKVQDLIIPNDTDVAWATGFYEDEGSIGCYFHNRTYGTKWILTLTISQKDKTALEYIYNTFKVGSLCSQKLNGLSSGDIWRWKVSGINAYKVAKLFLPFMKSTTKITQLNLALQIYDTTVLTKRRK